MTELPKIDFDDPGPGWCSVMDTAGKWLKPVIKCLCGQLCGIERRAVKADGTVVRDGRDWLKLLDYDCGEFPATRFGRV